MAVTMVTVAELHALRNRCDELTSVTAGLRRLGHTIPPEVADELKRLSGTIVDVVIRCLLCGAFGTSPVAIDGHPTPHAAICDDCDRGTWPEPDRP